jgi:hypothetical protein
MASGISAERDQRATFAAVVAMAGGQVRADQCCERVSARALDRLRPSDKKLENWVRSAKRGYGDPKPKTQLDRLCREFDDLWEEARRIRDEQINRDNIERAGRVFGDDWEWDEVDYY